MRFVIIIIGILTSLHLASNPVKAQNFTTSVNSTFVVNESGRTTANHSFSIKNLTSNQHISQYQITIGSTNLKNITVSQQNNLPITLDTTENSLTTTIILIFEEPIIGKNQINQFELSYQDPQRAEVNGQTLEINLPKPEVDANQLTTTIRVPRSFGDPVKVSPPPTQTSTDPAFTTLEYNHDTSISSSLNLIFGNTQTYAFNITFTLENPTITPIITHIILPPDTAYQKVNYHAIEPRPQSIKPDPDGNWIAQYQLDANEKQFVKARGTVTTHLKPSVAIPEYIDRNAHLKNDAYWPVNDRRIQTIAQSLSGPEEIYQYVVNTLSYSYTRLQNDQSRLGAKQILESPDQALCQEFTDLFITLARAKNIPARAIIGYAHTNDDHLQPLSLAQGTLHTWPEYYDEQKKHWVPVDPTWHNTTGGIDYFETLDVNHLTFAIFGHQSDQPQPAALYQTTQTPSFTVSLSPKTDSQSNQLHAKLTPLNANLFGLTASTKLTLTNPTGNAQYHLPITLTTSSGTLLTNSPVMIESLLPFQSTTTPFTFTNLDIQQPLELSVKAKTHESTHQLTTKHLTPRWWLLVPLAALTGFFLIFATQRTWRLLVSR